MLVHQRRGIRLPDPAFEVALRLIRVDGERRRIHQRRIDADLARRVAQMKRLVASSASRSAAGPASPFPVGEPVERAHGPASVQAADDGLSAGPSG